MRTSASRAAGPAAQQRPGRPDDQLLAGRALRGAGRGRAAETLRRHAPDRYARSRQLAAGYAAKLPDGGFVRITQPVLVISGDEDPLFKAPAAGRALAKTFPHSRFVLVHRMGHRPSAPLWPELAREISQHATVVGPDWVMGGDGVTRSRSGSPRS